MIDKEYTASVRAAANSGRDYTHQVYTEDEVDWLLSSGASDTTGGIVALTEEAMYRSTGLKVDLAAQGPMATSLVRAGESPGQEHNTFIVDKDDSSRRIQHLITRDRDTIPKVTPQDANQMVRSIDFPMTRKPATALDGMRINDKDNPIEAAFISAITIAQILKHWGLDAGPMIDAIDTHWGITYAGDLVNDLALAKVADLEMYLATGGRPDPAAYISPNIMSTYKVIQGPTVDAVAAGYSQAFIGRGKMITKFVMATCNIMRGNGSLNSLRMHMNPAHMSTFDPADLKGWKVDSFGEMRLTPRAGSVEGLQSKSTFLQARMASAVAIRNDKVALARNVLAVESLDRNRLANHMTVKYQSMPNALIANALVSQAVLTRKALQTVASKVTTSLLNMYTGIPDPELFGSLLITCAELTYLCGIPTAHLNLASVLDRIKRSSGLGECLTTFNLLNAEKISELKNLGIKYPHYNKRTMYGVFLIKRQVAHMRAMVRNALKSAHDASSGNYLIPGQADLEIERINGMNRLMPVIAAILQDKARPYSYIRSHKAAATASSSNVSLMELSGGLLHQLAGTMASGAGRSMLSGIRAWWVEYYTTMSRSYQNALHSACGAGQVAVNPRLTKFIVSSTEVDQNLLQIAAHAIYVEAVVAAASRLAYKWVEIRVDHTKFSFSLDGSSPEAIAAIMTRYMGMVESGFDFDANLKANGHVMKIRLSNKMAKEFKQAATYIARAMNPQVAKSLIKVILSDIIDAYKNRIEGVRSSMLEAIHKDQAAAALRLGLREESLSDSDFEDAHDEELEPGPAAAEDPGAADLSAEDDMMNVLQAMLSSASSSGPSLDAYASRVRELLSAGAYDVGMVDQEMQQVMLDVAGNLTSRLASVHQTLFDSIILDLLTVVDEEEDVIASVLHNGMRSKLNDMAAAFDIRMFNANIMS